MRSWKIIVLAIVLTLVCGCKRMNTTQGKADAKTVTAAATCIVADSTADPSKQQHYIYSADQGDCVADLVVGVRPSGSQYVYQLGIDHTNSQFQNYMKLRVGDTVRFDYSEAPVQQRCGSGAFLRLIYSTR